MDLPLSDYNLRRTAFPADLPSVLLFGVCGVIQLDQSPHICYEIPLVCFSQPNAFVVSDLFAQNLYQRHGSPLSLIYYSDYRILR
jgi:hypothetical protein